MCTVIGKSCIRNAGELRLLADSLIWLRHRESQNHKALYRRSNLRTFVQRTVSELRIIPLGGSITYGLQSSDGNGYRHILREMLTSDGHLVDMVGSRKAGSMEDNDNEGWRGFRIEQVARRARDSIQKFQPELVLVNVGSNDCIQNFQIENAGERMEYMLNYLLEASPHPTVILSTLLTNADEKTESRVLQVNDQFRALVAEKAAQGRKVVLADMYGPNGVKTSDLADGTHPNDVGYAKMAGIWHESIREAVVKTFIPGPIASEE